jgi:tetratricopeptide (TPR) repeat protein
MLRQSTRTCLAAILLILAAEPSFAARTETWTEVRSPNFLVLTDANEKQGRRVALQFETIRAVFRQFFSISGAAKDPALTIIAVRNEDGMKRLMPEFWARKGLSHPAGIYVPGPEKNYIALQLDVAVRPDSDDPWESIYHEYVHLLMRRLISQLPLWMVEGLAEFFGNTKVEGRTFFVGAPSHTNLEILHRTELLPLSTLFAVDASSPYYHEENKTSIFYAESWLLTHYLVTRDWKEGTHRTYDFIHLLGQSVRPEEAARRTIGDPAQVREELQQYLYRSLYTAAGLPMPPSLDANLFTAEPASPAESLAVQADFMAHDRHSAEAQKMLEEALQLEPKLAAAHESMGLIFMQQGKIEEAIKWYAQAVALNSQSYLANYYYGVSLLKGQSDEATATQAESSLRAAIKIAPEFAPAYDAMANRLVRRPETQEEAYRMELKAVSLEEGNVHYRLNAARVLERMGRDDDAVRVAEFAVSMAKTPDEQREAVADLAMARQHQEQRKRMKEEVESFYKAQNDAAARRASQETRGQAGAGGSHSISGSGVDSGPPTLRPQDETAPDSESETSDHPERPELELTPRLAEGVIEKAECSGSTIEVTVKNSSGEIHLYSDRYMKLLYSALNFTPKETMNPCRDLQGWHARISYRPAKDKVSPGEMMAVVLVKD